jgi:flagellar protein FliO/FliZ
MDIFLERFGEEGTMRIALVFLTAIFCLNARAESDEALVAAAEKLVAEAAATQAEKVEGKKVELKESKTKEPEIKESDIPVVMSPLKVAKTESSVIWRLVASMVFLVTVGGILTYAARRWTRKRDKGGKRVRIEVLHQMHLGPRKSLALVRVSGEVMLVGISDHNINMIKSIALIDDELEETVKGDFNGFLDDEFSVEDMRTIMGSRN